MNFPLLLWLLACVQSFSAISNYANISSLNIVSNYTTIINDGNISFVGNLNGSQYRILKYDLMTTPINLLGSYILNSTHPERFIIYQNYLVVYSYSYDKVQLFNYTNFNRINATSIGLGKLLQLEQAKSLNSVVYLAASGKFGYLKNFLTSNTVTIILQNILLNSSFCISPNQAYVALTISNKFLLIYRTSNWTLALNQSLTITTKNYQFKMCWKSDSSQLFVAPQNEGEILIFTTSSGFNMSSFIFIVKNTYTVSDIGYNSVQQNLIIAGYPLVSTTVQIIVINLATNSVQASQNISLPFSNSRLNFDDATNQCFAVWQSSQIKFYRFDYLSNVNSSNSSASSNTTFLLNSSALSNLSALQNSTFSLNSSASSNSSALLNLSVLSNISNTNSTYNSSLNFTNLTATSNFSNLSNIQNLSDNYSAFNSNSSTNLDQYFTQSDQLQLQMMLNSTLLNPFLLFCNKVPASRTILKPLSNIFMNFDELWLYNYHNRSYDQIITTIFVTIQYIQNQKWSQLHYQNIWSFFGFNDTKFKQKLNDKYNFTQNKFIQIQGFGNGFFINTLDFFFSNFFLILALYLLCRLLFYCLFSYKISILLRNFSFCIYFGLMILQGNLQYFTYLFAFQISHLFSYDAFDKIILSVTLLVYFLILFFAVSFIFISKYFYKKLTKYIAQNVQTNINSGIFFIVGQTGLKNILIGFLHFFFQQNYYAKISSLLCAQILFLMWTIKILSFKQIFQNHLKIWVYCMFTFLRILIIFTFFLDYDNSHTIVEKSHFILVYVMIGLMFISLFIELLKILIVLIVYIKKIKWNSNIPPSECVFIQKPTQNFQNQNLVEDNIKKRSNKNIHIFQTKFLNTKFPQQISFDQYSNTVNVKFLQNQKMAKTNNVLINQCSQSDLIQEKPKSKTIKVKKIRRVEMLQKEISEVYGFK